MQLGTFQKMTENSWQEYVEKDLLGSHHIKEAMIIGVEDATIWASSPSFAHITQEEVDSIIQLFQQDKEVSYETGIRLFDQHFVCKCEFLKLFQTNFFIAHHKYCLAATNKKAIDYIPRSIRKKWITRIDIFTYKDKYFSWMVRTRTSTFRSVECNGKISCISLGNGLLILYWK